MPSFVWRPISDNKKGNFPVRRHECERLQTERRVDGRSTLWQIARRTGCVTEWQAIASGSNNPQSAANFSGRHKHCVTPSPLAHFWALSLLALPVQLGRSARLSHHHYNSAGLVPRANYQTITRQGKMFMDLNSVGTFLCTWRHFEHRWKNVAPNFSMCDLYAYLGHYGHMASFTSGACVNYPAVHSHNTTAD